MKMLRYLVFFFAFFLLSGCQKEEKTIIRDDTQSFVKDSPLAKLLSRTSQHPTNKDNVLDNSGLVSVQLPVTVLVNGTTITVASPADYPLVQNAINANSNDDDIVHFTYPITIQFQNYDTQSVGSYNQLQQILQVSGTDESFNEIDCISLVYPITFSVYDTNTQTANPITIANNSNLFNFLANLTSGSYAAINYPISVEDSSGQTVIIDSNATLTNFIENSIDDCNNNSGGGNQASLSQVLTNGSWNISYCYYEGNNETSLYQGYNFAFNANGTVIAQRNSVAIDGDWDINDQNEYQRLSLNFDGSNLHDVETNWRVIEYNATVIKLKDENSNSTDYLTFSKN